MKTITARSTKKDTKDAVSEVASALKSVDNIKAVMFFACSDYDNSVIALMQAEFPGITVFGCTSMAEMLNAEYTTNSIVATAFTDELIEDIKTVVLTKVAPGKVDIDDEIAELEEYYGTAFYTLDKEKYFGIVICCPVLSKISEVEIYDEIGDRTSCVFTGATASSTNFVFENVRIYGNGQAYENSAVLALVKSKVPFAFEKMEAVERMNVSASITKMADINPETGAGVGIVQELEGINPADFFSKIYDLPREEIIKMDINDVMRYSLGIVIDGSPFMHTTEYFFPDGSLQLNPPTYPGSHVELFEARDLIPTTREQMAKIREKHPDTSYIVAFDCAYRYLDGLTHHTLEEYTGMWKGIPMMGLATFGEYFICKVSQTTGMLLLK
ncbi:MAG: hypothetical protein LBO69_09025 [Ignavibacteria bacterium]|jgi:hypothetical protein|nr:hypothetical protein [Ignavibacteria bacterium]